MSKKENTEKETKKGAVKSPSIKESDILAMPRSDIRYALYRCKKGNPEDKHKAIYKFYQDQLDEFDFIELDFAEEGGWDISKIDTTEVVTGRTVLKYIKELHAPSVQ